MAVVGFGSLMDKALPSLWDADYLKKIDLAEGVSLEAITQEANDALEMVSREVLQHPHYSGLFAVDDEAELEYPIGHDDEWEEATEYTAPDARRGKTTGHMLPIKKYDWALGWTNMYLREARPSKLRADIQKMIDTARNLWQKQALTRLFSKTANSVGTTSSDVPWADAGSADSTYVPPQSPEGETFTSSHNHFLGYGTSGITQDTIDQSAVTVAIEHLQEHGFSGPWDLVGSRTDAGSWANTANVTGWKPPLFNGVAYQGSAVERAIVGDISKYMGFIETEYGIVRVWLTPRVPTLNFSVYQTFGAGHPRNPMRMRYNPNVGFGFRLVPGHYIDDPVSLLVGYSEFGYGVGEDRCAAVCVDLQASTYANPTIS